MEKIRIANPIYDAAFKYLMGDIKAAKVLLSALLDAEIEILELLPQERSLALAKEVPQLSVVRFDYCATLLIHGERKKVLIELQKGKSSVDVARFRRYLGLHYKDHDLIEGKQCSLPIIAVYIFGFNMQGVDPAITCFYPQGKDISEGIPITARSDIIDLLNHTSYYVQLPKLSTKSKNRVERVLSVFSQQWIYDKDSSILMLPQAVRQDQEVKVLVNRLEHALFDKDTQRQVTEELAFEDHLEDELQLVKRQGIAEGKEQLILSMFKNQLSEDLIEKITDFPKEKINELEKRL